MNAGKSLETYTGRGLLLDTTANLYITEREGNLVYYDIQQHKELFSLTSKGLNEYLIKTPENYFLASKKRHLRLGSLRPGQQSLPLRPIRPPVQPPRQSPRIHRLSPTRTYSKLQKSLYQAPQKNGLPQKSRSISSSMETLTKTSMPLPWKSWTKNTLTKHPKRIYPLPSEQGIKNTSWTDWIFISMESPSMAAKG